MTDPRVPRLHPEEATAAAGEAGVPELRGRTPVFRVLLNHPTLSRGFDDLLLTLLWHGKFDTRLREWRSCASGG